MSLSQPIENKHGHLGTPLEVAIIVIFVCLVVVLIGASVFHIRRKQKEKRPQTEQRAFDVERGQRRNQCKNRIQRPTLTYSRDSENPGKLYTSLSGGTAIEELRSDAGVAAPVERRLELAKPPPITQLKRYSKTSCHEYVAKHPPKYYWDQSRSM